MGRTPSPLWTSTHGRHEIHTALLKWLVYNDLPDLKLKFDYMIVIYLNYTFSNLYRRNLYRRKISDFFLSKDEILVKIHSRKKCGIKIPHLMWMVIYAHPLCTYILLNVYVLCIRNFLHEKVWMFLAG